MPDAYILDALRTPFGRLGGALAAVRPDDLAARVLAALLERNPRLDAARIDDVVFGDANAAGEDNRDVARMALLLAGWPVSVPGSTVNRLCGSGMEAVIGASRAIVAGDASLVVAGGTESMSRAPWILLKPDRAFPTASEQLHSSTLGWRMINPNMPAEWTVSLGEATEQLREHYGISREQQDLYSLNSHLKAAQAWDAGWYEREVIDVPGVGLNRDESVRPDTSLTRLGGLRPVFRPDGTITAGNSSPMNDGAAALLLADETVADELGPPLARVVARAVCGVDPRFFGIGPVEAANRALSRAGLKWTDLSLVEMNEAFAAQSLACLAEWRDLDPSIVNVQGGAIALGHPLGASGARIIGHLAHALKDSGGYGLAAICIGVGQGLAVVLEAC